MVLHVDRGDRLDQRELLRRLTGLQYTRNDMDFARATFRVRGDVIDIFPAESDLEAVRIELFDDEVESLSAFDPLTGEVIRKLPRFTFYPKSHYVTPRETLLDAIEKIKDELRERLDYLRSQNKLVEAQRLEQRTRFDLEMIMELGYCNGIENYSRYLSGRDAGEPPPTLFDYLPADALLVIDESHVSVPQVGAMYKGDRSRKETLVEYGFRLPSALDNRPMRFDEWEAICRRPSSSPRRPGHTRPNMLAAWWSRSCARPAWSIRRSRCALRSPVDDLLSEIRKCVAKEERVLVTTLTKRMSEDLTDYLGDHNVKVRYLHSDIDTVERVEIIRDLRTGTFDVLVGINLLREGLDMPEVSLVAILDADKEGFLRSERSLIQPSAALRATSTDGRFSTRTTSPAPCSGPSTRPSVVEPNRSPSTKLTASCPKASRRMCRTSSRCHGARLAQQEASGRGQGGRGARATRASCARRARSPSASASWRKRCCCWRATTEFEAAAEARDEIHKLRELLLQV